MTSVASSTALPKLEAGQMPELARIDATLHGIRVVWLEPRRNRYGGRSRREQIFPTEEEARQFAWTVDMSQVCILLRHWLVHAEAYGRCLRTAHGHWMDRYLPEARDYMRAISHRDMTPERSGKGVAEKIAPLWDMVQPERKGPEMVEWLKGRELLALFGKRYYKEIPTQGRGT